MFYSTQILAKKGPLGLVWIAAHLDGRLKRQQINSASIGDSVDTLLHPEAPLALRLSGQLLLGVVRIYQRKVNYLHKDCEEAVVKFKTALRANGASQGAGVDLPAGADRAAEDEITMSLPGGPDGSAEAADYLWGGEQLLLLGGRGGAGTGLSGLGGSGTLTLLPSGSGGSGRLTRELSDVWGLHTSTEGETFDLDGANPDDIIPWDLDDWEVERLRAVSQSQGGGPPSQGDPGPGAGGPRPGAALEGLTPGSDARTTHKRGRPGGSEAPTPFDSADRALLPEARAAGFDRLAASFDQPAGAGADEGMFFDDDDIMLPPADEELEAAAAEAAAAARRAAAAGGGAPFGGDGSDDADGDGGGGVPGVLRPQDSGGGDEGAGEWAAAEAEGPRRELRPRPGRAAVAAEEAAGTAAGRGGGPVRERARGRAARGAAARGPAVLVDVWDGRASTQLDAACIRALLSDRAPLLKQCGERPSAGSDGAATAVPGGGRLLLWFPLLRPPAPAGVAAGAAGREPDAGGEARAGWEDGAFGIDGLLLGPPGLSFFSVGHGAPSAAACLPEALLSFSRAAAGDGEDVGARQGGRGRRRWRRADEEGGEGAAGEAAGDGAAAGGELGMAGPMDVDRVEQESDQGFDHGYGEDFGHDSDCEVHQPHPESSSQLSEGRQGAEGAAAAAAADEAFDESPPRSEERGAAREEAAEAARPARAPQAEPWPADAETLQELGEADDEEELPGSYGAPGAPCGGGGGGGGGGGFTGRTRLVMRQLQRTAAGPAAAAAAPAAGSKRKRVVAAPAPAHGAGKGDEMASAAAGGAAEVSLAGLTAGRGRMDACRWFYEMLVLQNRSLARLRQEEPYGDIAVTPDLRAMAAI